MLDPVSYTKKNVKYKCQKSGVKKCSNRNVSIVVLTQLFRLDKRQVPNSLDCGILEIAINRKRKRD